MSLQSLFQRIPLVASKRDESSGARTYHRDQRQLRRVNKSGRTFVYLQHRRPQSQSWEGWCAEFRPEQFEQEPTAPAVRLGECFKSIGMLAE